MNIYTHISSGEFHPLYGEDFQYHQIINGNWFIGAVMDGCSSGQDSHFASVAYGKSLRKSCRMLPNLKQMLPGFDMESMKNEALGAFILQQLFRDIKKISKLFYLNEEEILSTMILLVYDLNDNSAWIHASGDGIIVCNGEIYEIDQQNVPDYLGYHLDSSFEDWFENHTTQMKFDNIQDLSISTDGIAKLKNSALAKSNSIDVLDYFLIERPQYARNSYLTDRFNTLVDNEGFIAYDDISIIRLVA